MPRITAHFAALLLLVVLPVGCSRTSEDQESVPAAIKPTWITKAEEERLNKASDSKTIDEMDVFVASTVGMEDADLRKQRVAALALTIKVALHQLFYEVDLRQALHPSEDLAFHRVLSDFEKRAQLQVDGRFTIREMGVLSGYAALAGESEVRPSPGAPMVFAYKQFGLVQAEGTWSLKGDTIAAPVNRSEIECHHTSRLCTVFTADVYLPRIDGASTSASLLTGVEYYDITLWTDDEVKAVTTTGCRRNELVVNVATKQVHTVSTDTTPEGCPVVGKLETPRIATLEDGWKATDEYFKQRREILKKVSYFPLDRLAQMWKEPENTPATKQ